MNETNKMKVISYNSRILNTQEQKLSTLDRELLAMRITNIRIFHYWISSSNIYLQITNRYYLVLQKKETLVLDFIEHKCN